MINSQKLQEFSEKKNDGWQIRSYLVIESPVDKKRFSLRNENKGVTFFNYLITRNLSNTSINMNKIYANLTQMRSAIKHSILEFKFKNLEI